MQVLSLCLQLPERVKLQDVHYFPSLWPASKAGSVCLNTVFSVTFPSVQPLSNTLYSVHLLSNTLYSVHPLSVTFPSVHPLSVTFH